MIVHRIRIDFLLQNQKKYAKPVFHNSKERDSQDISFGEILEIEKEKLKELHTDQSKQLF